MSNNFLRIDETLEIDQNYITCAEYQLFLNHCQQNKLEIDFPSPWVNPNISRTDIKLKEAYLFCLWLHQNYSDNNNIYYRLPTPQEKANYPIQNDQLLAEDGIRLVKFSISNQIDPRFHHLLLLLAFQQWYEADQETTQLILEIANCEKKGFLTTVDIRNFPSKYLRIIDELWLKYSNNHFGFSVQKQIWIDCGGKLDGNYQTDIYKKFGDRIGWRKNNDWLSYPNNYTFNTKLQKGHLPYVVFLTQLLKTPFKMDRVRSDRMSILFSCLDYRT